MTDGFFLGGLGQGLRGGIESGSTIVRNRLLSRDIEQRGELGRRGLELREREVLAAEDAKNRAVALKEFEAIVSEIKTVAEQQGPDAARKLVQTLDRPLGGQISMGGQPVPLSQFGTQIDLLAGRIGIDPRTLRGQIGRTIEFAATPETKAKAKVAGQVAETAAADEARKAGALPPAPAFEGQGFKQQSFNFIIGYNLKKKAGEATTPEEDLAYSLAVNDFESEKIVTLPDGRQAVQKPRLPGEFMRPEGSFVERQPEGPNISGGPRQPGFPSVRNAQSEPATTITPIGDKKPKLPEQAGRTAMIEQGLGNVKSIIGAILKPDPARPGETTVDREMVFTTGLDLPFMGKGLPFSKGRGVRAQLQDAASAKLRIETGAQANQQEIADIIDRYMPSMLDNDDTIRDKLSRMDQFFSTSLRLTEPELYATMVKRARDSGAAPQPPKDAPDAVFAGYDERGLPMFRLPDGRVFVDIPESK